MPQSLSAVYIHLVFSTKERFPFLRDTEIRQGTFAYLSGTSKNLDCPTITVGGMGIMCISWRDSAEASHRPNGSRNSNECPTCG